MAFLWAWVPHRKERKALESAIKPANAQERKALRQFGKATSAILLRETSLMKSEHSLAQLKEKLLGAAWPAKQNGNGVRVNFSVYVPPGLKLDGNVFPALSTLMLISGMKSYGRKDMLLQADYHPSTGKLTLEMPSMVHPGVSGNPLVKSALGALSGSMELTPFNYTKLTVHAEKA